MEGSYSEKKNSIEYGGETCFHSEAAIRGRFNKPKKGNFTSEIKIVSLNFNGESNSAIGFEMLNALKPGINYVWDFGYQRLISKNLQISIHYNGRKSQESTIIHSGNMEIRALF